MHVACVAVLLLNHWPQGANWMILNVAKEEGTYALPHPESSSWHLTASG